MEGLTLGRAGRHRALVWASDVWMLEGLRVAVREVYPEPSLILTSPVLASEDEPATDASMSEGLTCAVFWLPPVRHGLGEAVQHLMQVLPRCRVNATVILLTREPPEWLYRTLRNLVPGAHPVLERLVCLSDLLTTSCVQQAVRGLIPEGGIYLKDVGGGKHAPGLSYAELITLTGTLSGEDIHSLSARTGWSARVLHRLRWQALQKLGGLRVKNLRRAGRHRR